MVGMSFAVFANLGGAGLLALFVPAITSKWQHAGLLGLFAFFNFVTLVLVFLFVPETKEAVGFKKHVNEQGKDREDKVDEVNDDPVITTVSLEQLYWIFGAETWKHIQYQYKEVLREYFWRKYIRREKDVPEPPPFYTWKQLSKRQRARSETKQPENAERIERHKAE